MFQLSNLNAALNFKLRLIKVINIDYTGLLQCHEPTTLSLYHFLRVIKPIGFASLICPRDGGLLKLYPYFFISLYTFGLNPSLVCIVGRSLYSWSKPLEEVMTSGRGVLVILQLCAL